MCYINSGETKQARIYGCLCSAEKLRSVRPSFVLAHLITMFRFKWWNNNHIQAQHTMVGEKIVYSIEEGAELWRQLSSQEMSCQVECHSTQEQTHE